MPNTSSSVPFLLSSSMSSIRSRRPSACLSSSQGSGLLQQLGSGMVRQLTVGPPSYHHPINGRTLPSTSVRKCPSWMQNLCDNCCKFCSRLEGAIRKSIKNGISYYFIDGTFYHMNIKENIHSTLNMITQFEAQCVMTY